MNYTIDIRTGVAGIARNLRAGPDYSPNWRFQVVEALLPAITGSSGVSRVAATLIDTEPDPVIRQVARFHTGKHCVISAEIEYALRCHRSRNANGMAEDIEAAVIACVDRAQIARQSGTGVKQIWVYEMLHYDVRRFRDASHWQKRLVYNSGSRLAITALERGLAGLQVIYQWHRERYAHVGEELLNRLWLGLLARALDYYTGMELSGAPTTERDLAWFGGFQRFIHASGFPAELRNLDYPKPLTPEEIKSQAERYELTNGLSADARRRIVTFLMRVQSVAQQCDDASVDQPPPAA